MQLKSNYRGLSKGAHPPAPPTDDPTVRKDAPARYNNYLFSNSKSLNPPSALTFVPNPLIYSFVHRCKTPFFREGRKELFLIVWLV